MNAPLWTNLRNQGRKERCVSSLRRILLLDGGPPQSDLSGHVQTLMQRVTDNPLQQIDDLIAGLRRRREQLLSESARVQREVLEYAKLNQTTMQSNKIITESLAHLNKTLRRLPAPGEEEVEDISEQQDDGPEAFAQPGELGEGHHERGEGRAGKDCAGRSRGAA